MPKKIRVRASQCLRHYPGYFQIEEICEQLPELFDLATAEGMNQLNRKK